MTDVILREEVPPLNIASELTYLDKLKRAILTTYWPLGFDGVKGDMTRSSKDTPRCSLDYRMFDDSCDDSNGDSDTKM
ncbi:hypothetical protein HBH92_247080 [Parastagonospora nodorum]|nr:hypothetical protein HBH92_247080 [Parastagonospora nodorum]KAH4401572.1 hypothetical protein HBH93_242440 [Parastagonospora nodorum]KAH4523083.1 hypothetical protein HBH85_240420 [Parastagonospora nodorum]